jgi:hypothetical protein
VCKRIILLTNNISFEGVAEQWNNWNALKSLRRHSQNANLAAYFEMSRVLNL